jgi:hypothetical protein
MRKTRHLRYQLFGVTLGHIVTVVRPNFGVLDCGIDLESTLAGVIQSWLRFRMSIVATLTKKSASGSRGTSVGPINDSVGSAIVEQRQGIQLSVA